MHSTQKLEIKIKEKETLINTLNVELEWQKLKVSLYDKKNEQLLKQVKILEDILRHYQPERIKKKGKLRIAYKA